jgi:hypothetical protein
MLVADFLERFRALLICMRFPFHLRIDAGLDRRERIMAASTIARSLREGVAAVLSGECVRSAEMGPGIAESSVMKWSWRPFATIPDHPGRWPSEA